MVPVFNEERTLETCLRRVLAAELPAGWSRSLHLVDDHSQQSAYDAAHELARQLQDEGHPVSMQRHDRNRGKGAALRTGFDAVLAGDPPDEDVVIIQDADLEYDPDDYAALLEPIRRQEVRVVIGTRWGQHRGTGPASLKRRTHAFGNAALSFISNRMTGYRLGDMECCYKLLTIPVLTRVRPMLTEDRFGVEPQLVASLARLGEPIEEVPIRYQARDWAAGKKIGWKDAVRALIVIGRERLRGGPARRPRGPRP